MKTCVQSDERAEISPRSVVELYVRRRKADLNVVEEAVLALLVEAAALLPGEPAVAMSRHEIAKEIHTPFSTVQRALNTLVDKGLIARRQDEKKYGVVSITLVSRTAFAYFGLEGGAAIGVGGLPQAFGPLLARESESFIARVAKAWREGGTLTAADEAQYRGSSRDLAQIVFLLQGRVDELGRQTLQAIAEAEQAEAEMASGLLRVRLHDDTEIVLDQHALMEAAGELPRRVGSVVACADMRIVQDVFQQIRERTPFCLTAANAPRIAAEVLFSRHKGFAIKHDAEAAGRIMANVISRGTWQRPKGIDPAWYTSTASAVRVVRAQGVQLCAA
jgi:DNA-binding MarR family transcriptional regulator